uniref:Hexosyltransferase n=1 Tax=Acrobeloides nanus TaxID=290746 RepID=A0A914E0Y3_9BILA
MDFAVFNVRELFGKILASISAVMLHGLGLFIRPKTIETEYPRMYPTILSKSKRRSRLPARPATENLDRADFIINFDQHSCHPECACLYRLPPITKLVTFCNFEHHYERPRMESIDPRAQYPRDDLTFSGERWVKHDIIQSGNYIRSTWKKSLEPEIPVIFVTGLGNFDLVPESSQYDDILQLDFVDSYMNLTHKMIATYKYVLRKRSIKHIIVINDDTIVNGTALKRQLLTAQFHPEKRYVIGKVSRGYPRLFFPWLLWYVPGEMYPHKCYPPFVQGSSFIISREAASEISQRICDFPFVHLDDIMMGVVTNCLGIRNVHKEGFDKHFPRICDFPFVHLDDIMMGVVTNCLGIRNVHKEGFDKHVPESFTVFHYQYSRYSVEKLQNLWTDLKRNKEL